MKNSIYEKDGDVVCEYDNPIKMFLEYEIHGCIITRYISWKWLQEIAGAYFLYKTKRKFKRYVVFKNYQLTLKK